jgi:hypothetical protein
MFVCDQQQTYAEPERAALSIKASTERSYTLLGVTKVELQIRISAQISSFGDGRFFVSVK